MSAELNLLLAEAAAIPDDDIQEPDQPLAAHHNVIGKVDDLETQKIFTLYNRKVRELANIHHLVSGPMKVRGRIPDQVQYRMMELQDQMDLLRIIFFYSISKRFRLFDRQFIHVHEGWLVSWSNQHTPPAVFPNLGSLSKDDDNDDDDDPN